MLGAFTVLKCSRNEMCDIAIRLIMEKNTITSKDNCTENKNKLLAGFQSQLRDQQCSCEGSKKNLRYLIANEQGRAQAWGKVIQLRKNKFNFC